MLHSRIRFSCTVGLLFALYIYSGLLYAAPETPRSHPTENGLLFLPLVAAAPPVLPTLRTAQLVKDIFPGPTASNPYSLLARGSGITFVASTPGQEQIAMRSNGTSRGTTLFPQILPDSASASVAYQGEVNDALLFTASNAQALTLWRTDRAFNNAEVLVTVPADTTNPTLRTLALVANNLFFFVGDASGSKLWKTDGTTAGTHLVSDANIALDTSDPYLTTLDTSVFFSAVPAEGKRELWRSDGTSAGTVRIKTFDVNDGTQTLTYLKTQGKTILFALREFGPSGEAAHHLWKSDGTDQGTVRIADVKIVIGQNGLALIPSDGSYQYFLGYNSNGKIALWRTDGTSAGTLALRDISYDEVNHYELQGATFTNNLHIFLFADSSGAYQLWRTDGTTQGTFQLHTGTLMLAGAIAQTDTLAFFVTQSGADGQESSLWRSDGTAKGTYQVLTVSNGSNMPSAFIDGLRTIGDSVLFRTGVAGGETQGIGFSDGSKAGTHTLTNVNSGDALLQDTPTIIDDVFYFAATDAAHGTELWKADGTNNTVQLVRDICPGSCSSAPEHITAVKNAIVFSADDGAHGSEIWRSDGTENGTALVYDIQPGSAGSSPNWFTLADEHIFFSAVRSDVGNELWVMPTSAASTMATQASASATSNPPRAARVSGTYRVVPQR